MQSVCYKYNCRIRPFKKLKQASVSVSYTHLTLPTN